MTFAADRQGYPRRLHVLEPARRSTWQRRRRRRFGRSRARFDRGRGLSAGSRERHHL